MTAGKAATKTAMPSGLLWVLINILISNKHHHKPFKINASVKTVWLLSRYFQKKRIFFKDGPRALSASLVSDSA